MSTPDVSQTPDPRDARIAELEAALLRCAGHPAIRGEMYGSDVALADRIKRDRALGEEARGG